MTRNLLIGAGVIGTGAVAAALYFSKSTPASSPAAPPAASFVFGSENAGTQPNLVSVGTYMAITLTGTTNPTPTVTSSAFVGAGAVLGNPIRTSDASTTTDTFQVLLPGTAVVTYGTPTSLTFNVDAGA